MYLPINFFIKFKRFQKELENIYSEGDIFGEKKEQSKIPT